MTRGPGRDGTPDFGLLDYQYGPRFAYGSIAALTATLTGASFRETLAESEDIHLYVFQRGSDLILAGFTLGEGATMVTIQHDAREVVAIDEMGNARPMASGSGIEIPLDGYPRYWVLRGATRVTRE